jgi:hypothetical protein
MMMEWTIRTLNAALLLALSAALHGAPAEAQTKEVKVALIAPLSGPGHGRGS